MLESMNDYISIIVLFLFVILGIRTLFSVSSKNHSSKLRERENRYLEMLDEMMDDTVTEEDNED